MTTLVIRNSVRGILVQVVNEKGVVIEGATWARGYKLEGTEEEITLTLEERQ